jgi:hypothetical protein
MRRLSQQSGDDDEFVYDAANTEVLRRIIIDSGTGETKMIFFELPFIKDDPENYGIPKVVELIKFKGFMTYLNEDNENELVTGFKSVLDGIAQAPGSQERKACFDAALKLSDGALKDHALSNECANYALSDTWPPQEKIPAMIGITEWYRKIQASAEAHIDEGMKDEQVQKLERVANCLKPLVKDTKNYTFEMKVIEQEMEGSSETVAVLEAFEKTKLLSLDWPGFREVKRRAIQEDREPQIDAIMACGSGSAQFAVPSFQDEPLLMGMGIGKGGTMITEAVKKGFPKGEEPMPSNILFTDGKDEREVILRSRPVDRSKEGDSWRGHNDLMTKKLILCQPQNATNDIGPDGPQTEHPNPPSSIDDLKGIRLFDDQGEFKHAVLLVSDRRPPRGEEGHDRRASVDDRRFVDKGERRIWRRTRKLNGVMVEEEVGLVKVSGVHQAFEDWKIDVTAGISAFDRRCKKMGFSRIKGTVYCMSSCYYCSLELLKEDQGLFKYVRTFGAGAPRIITRDEAVGMAVLFKGEDGKLVTGSIKKDAAKSFSDLENAERDYEVTISNSKVEFRMRGKAGPGVKCIKIENGVRCGTIEVNEGQGGRIIADSKLEGVPFEVHTDGTEENVYSTKRIRVRLLADDNLARLGPPLLLISVEVEAKYLKVVKEIKTVKRKDLTLMGKEKVDLKLVPVSQMLRAYQRALVQKLMWADELRRTQLNNGVYDPESTMSSTKGLVKVGEKSTKKVVDKNNGLLAKGISNMTLQIGMLGRLLHHSATLLFGRDWKLPLTIPMQKQLYGEPYEEHKVVSYRTAWAAGWFMKNIFRSSQTLPPDVKKVVRFITDLRDDTTSPWQALLDEPHNARKFLNMAAQWARTVRVSGDMMDEWCVFLCMFVVLPRALYLLVYTTHYIHALYGRMVYVYNHFFPTPSPQCSAQNSLQGLRSVCQREPCLPKRTWGVHRRVRRSVLTHPKVNR